MKGLGGQRPGPDNSQTMTAEAPERGRGNQLRFWESERKRGGGNPTAGQAATSAPSLALEALLGRGGKPGCFSWMVTSWAIHSFNNYLPDT